MESYYLKRHGSFATAITIALDESEVTVGHQVTPELKNAPNISPCHAVFQRSLNGQWFVKDMKSTSGVYVNSEKIGSCLYPVNLDDIIGLGTTCGDSERDYVFIMCNNHTLSLNSPSTAGNSQHCCAESGCLVIDSSALSNVGHGAESSACLACRKRNSLSVSHADNVSGNDIDVKIKKEVVEEELKTADKEKSIRNRASKTENHVFIKKEKPESPVNNDLCGSTQNVTNSAVHQLLFDSKNCDALADSCKNLGDLLVETPSVDNCEHQNIVEASNSSLKPSGSAVLVNSVRKTRKNSSENRSPENENCEKRQLPLLVKVAVDKYDDFYVQRYVTEQHISESDSSSSDVGIPRKQRAHRISSSSSSESEDAFVAHSDKKVDCSGSLFSGIEEKLHEVSSEHAEIQKGGGHKAPVSPEIISCATNNITSALSTVVVSHQYYTQEDKIIIILTDDDDNYDYSENPIPVNIKTESIENDDLSNSEWHFVSNSQSVYEQEGKDENVSDIKIEYASENVSLNSSALRTSLVTDHCQSVDDDNASEKDEDNLLNASENIENITEFLDNTSNNQSSPKKTLNGSNSRKPAAKAEINIFSHPFAQPLFSDDLKEFDASYSDPVELQNKEKHQKCISKNFKRPSISENKQKTPDAKVRKKSCSPSKNVESGIFTHSKHLENQKQSSENFDRSYFSENHRSLEERKANSCKKSTEAILNDFCKRQKEKTVSKTVLTEAMPIQYRSRCKRGREEWFQDQYDDDKPTENEVVSKQEKIEKSAEKNSKNKAAKSAVRHKDRKSEFNGTVTKRTRSKHKKNSGLRDQMQNKYIIIPPPSKSSAPAAAPSSNIKTYKSSEDKNISFPVKKKFPTDDIVAESVKQRRAGVNKTNRFSSRMSFLTEGVAAGNTGVNALRSKQKSPLHLTEKSSRKVSSESGIEVSDERKKSTEQPSVSKMSKVPEYDNTQTFPSSHVSKENFLTLDCSNPQILTSGQHVPAINLSSVQVSNLHHQNIYESNAPIVNSLNPHSQMISTSTNSSASVQVQSTSRSGVPITYVSASQITDLRLQGMPAANSPPSQAGPTVQVTDPPTIPVSCLSTSLVPNPVFQVCVPTTGSLPFQDSDPRLQVKFSVASSSSSQLADPRSWGKFPVQSLSVAQVSDPRFQAETNRSFNPVSHSSTKNGGTLASATRPPNVGVVAPQQSSRPKPPPKLTVKLNSETFILNILSWLPVWLREQQSMSFPPPVVNLAGMQPLELCYELFNDYALSFYNLLLVEMWESLFKDWKKKKTNKDFSFVVTSYSESSNFLTFECESVLSKRMSLYPVEGTLLIIDLRLEENRILILFGYTCHCKFQTLPEIARLHEELKKLPEAKEQNSQYCKFKFQTKKKDIPVCFNKRMKGCVLSYISVYLRIINSLVSLRYSPLMKDILCPQEKNCTISSVAPQSMGILQKKYNEAQASAIIAISDEMRKIYSVPRILLLQGPPGTGKTRVIIGIIENLLSKKHEKIKILVTAPSNAAADEIGRRLIALRKSQSRTDTPPLCFVRVGIPDQIHRDVSPFSLDSLVHINFKKSWNHEIKKLRATLSVLEAKKKNLKEEMESLKSASVPQQSMQDKQHEYSVLERRSRQCVDKIADFENKTVEHSGSSVYKMKSRILKNADVILSTLSSCRQSILETSFGENSDVHFTCCIVDEASQCTEPEVLQPLTYKMSKLLLVGDHQQLPATVHSEVAVKNNLGRSLFERIDLYFNSTLGRSPVYMLTE